MENKAAVNDKEPALSKAASGDVVIVVKSESQLKKVARRLKNIEKFRKKKEAQAGAKLKGGMGVDSPPPPTLDFAGHRGSLQGKNVEFDMRK